MNPLLDKYAAVTQAQKDREIELWRRWKFQKDQQALQELFESLRPIVKGTAYPWKASGLPGAVIEGEVKRNILDALEEFDPMQFPNVALSTFIISRSKKVNRMVYKHQNVARIPEQRITQIGTYNNVKSFLTDQLGREPNAIQMADELNWNVKDVERMEKETRKDIFSSSQVFEPTVVVSERDEEVMRLIYYNLSQEEQTVYDYLLGKHGKQMLKPTQIAQRTGMSPAKISRLRNSIKEKFQKYVGS